MSRVDRVRRHRRLLALGLLGIGLVLAARPAQSGQLCRWFNRCVYESPGFRLTVVDKTTGQPLAGVHALAEWVLYAPHGRNGPLMVQDAVSGPDGVLTFPAWGPLEGSRLGIVLNHDPALSLFKPGYRVATLFSAVKPGADETDRVRGLEQAGQTFSLEAFTGPPEEQVAQLRAAAYPPFMGRVADEQLMPFRSPLLNRARRIWDELATLPQERRDVANLSRSVGEDLKFYGGE